MLIPITTRGILKGPVALKLIPSCNYYSKPQIEPVLEHLLLNSFVFF